MVGILSNAIRPSRSQATPAMRNAFKKRSMLVGKAGEDLQCSFPIKLPEVAGLLLIV